MPVITRMRLTWTSRSSQELALASKSPGRLLQAFSWCTSWESTALPKSIFRGGFFFFFCETYDVLRNWPGVKWLGQVKSLDKEVLTLTQHSQASGNGKFFSHPNKVLKNRQGPSTEVWPRQVETKRSQTPAPNVSILITSILSAAGPDITQTSTFGVTGN